PAPADVPFNSIEKTGLPALKLTLLALRMPGPEAGETVPPEEVEVIVPTVPVPPKVPPFKLTALELCEPFTNTVPALIVVVPLLVLLALRVPVPVPYLVRHQVPLITVLLTVVFQAPQTVESMPSLLLMTVLVM